MMTIKIPYFPVFQCCDKFNSQVLSSKVFSFLVDFITILHHQDLWNSMIHYVKVKGRKINLFPSKALSLTFNVGHRPHSLKETSKKIALTCTRPLQHPRGSEQLVCTCVIEWVGINLSLWIRPDISKKQIKYEWKSGGREGRVTRTLSNHTSTSFHYLRCNATPQAPQDFKYVPAGMTCHFVTACFCPGQHAE